MWTCVVTQAIWSSSRVGNGVPPAECKTTRIVALSVMSTLLSICINRRVPVVVVMVCWEIYGNVVEVLIQFKL